MRDNPFRVRFQHIIDGWDGSHLSIWFVHFARCLACWSRSSRHFTRPQLVVMFWNLYLYHNPGRKRRLWPQCLNEDLNVWNLTPISPRFFWLARQQQQGQAYIQSINAMDLWILGSQEMMLSVVRFAGMGWLVMLTPPVQWHKIALFP